MFQISKELMPLNPNADHPKGAGRKLLGVSNSFMDSCDPMYMMQFIQVGLQAWTEQWLEPDELCTGPG